MTTPPAVAAAALAQAPAEVQASLTEAAYARLPMTLGLTTLVALGFGGAMWAHLPRAHMLVWLALLLLNTGSRALLCWAHHRASPRLRRHPGWHHGFTAGAMLSGLAWGYGPMVMLSMGARPEAALFVGTLLSVSAVALTSMSASPAAMLAFLAAAVLPPATAAALAGDDTSRLLSLVLMAGWLSLCLAGRRSAQATREQLLAQAALARALVQAETAQAQAESASLAKSRFLANMSHELRTPLNAVLGAAQLLRGDATDLQRQAYLTEAIQRSGTDLLGLIDNILDLSRIEAGQMPLQSQPFDLVDAVQTAVAGAALPARAKGLRLACVVDPALAALRLGDAARLRQVLMNLLGNAVKFTAQGEIVVRVRPGPAPAQVLLSVQDSGVGIAAASLAQIFEPFRQADDGADRRFGGSGLGLAIVRQLVQAMGGQVSVHSQPGHGACFAVALPLPALPDPAPPAAGPMAGTVVAFFEPHEASAQALQAMLQRLGCAARRCRQAADLREALAPAGHAQAPWLLVASDAPGCDGLLAQALEQVATERLLPMVDEPCSETDAARDGLRLARQLVRPIDLASLAHRLAGAMATGGAGSPWSPGLAAPVPQGLLSTAQHQALPRVLVVEDDALNRAIVCGLLEQARCRVLLADGGAQALALLAQGPLPDLVFTDCQMPGMDGLELTRRLRAGQAGPAAAALPIVALTANAFAEDRARCLAAGMDDFISKPVLYEQLCVALARWCPGAALAPAPAPAQPAASLATTPAAAATTGPAVYDPTVLASLPMVADGSAPDVAAELLAMFMQSLPATLQALTQAQAGGDAAALLRAVHTLKSGSASVGALALAQRCALAEQALRSGQPAGPDLQPGLLQDVQRLRQALASTAPHALSETTPCMTT